MQLLLVLVEVVTLSVCSIHSWKIKDVALYGVEAAGQGVETGKHAAAIQGGQTGVLHGAFMYLLQDENGFVQEAHSISAGLDYPGVGPEHCNLHESGRATYDNNYR